MKIKPLLKNVEMFIPSDVKRYLAIHKTAHLVDPETGESYIIMKGINKQ